MSLESLTLKFLEILDELQFKYSKEKRLEVGRKCTQLWRYVATYLQYLETENGKIIDERSSKYIEETAIAITVTIYCNPERDVNKICAEWEIRREEDERKAKTKSETEYKKTEKELMEKMWKCLGVGRTPAQLVTTSVSKFQKVESVIWEFCIEEGRLRRLEAKR